MLGYILIWIFASVVSFYIYKRNKANSNTYSYEEDLVDKFFSYFFVFLIIPFVSVLFYILLFLSVKTFTSNTIYKTEKQEIVSINRNNSLNGNFFIGSGYINSQKVYVVMKKLGNGRYQEENLPQDTVIIEEEGLEYPYFSYRVVDSSKSSFYNVVSFETEPLYNNYISNIELHVPKNTIIKDIHI